MRERLYGWMVLFFPGAIYSEAFGWGAGVFALLAFRLCNSQGMQRKKGGVYELEKLRSGAKRNGAILT